MLPEALGFPWTDWKAILFGEANHFLLLVNYRGFYTLWYLLLRSCWGQSISDCPYNCLALLLGRHFLRHGRLEVVLSADYVVSIAEKCRLLRLTQGEQKVQKIKSSKNTWFIGRYVSSTFSTLGVPKYPSKVVGTKTKSVSNFPFKNFIPFIYLRLLGTGLNSFQILAQRYV